MLIFDDDGCIQNRVELDTQGPNKAIEIPGHVWHTVLAKEPKTTLFEFKQGPYQPLEDKEFAAWSPPEGMEGCIEFVKRCHTALIGDNLSAGAQAETKFFQSRQIRVDVQEWAEDTL